VIVTWKVVITDLVQIRRLGEKKRDENGRFRKYMKSRVFVERQFRKAADEVHDEIDCRQCAECCRVTEVPLAERDIQKLAHFLGLSDKSFLEKHTARDEGGELILRRNAPGCEFLRGNDCMVYEARPGNCERFPHLLRGSGSLESRMWDLVDRATYCPIVYNWMEKVKALTKFRPSSGR
jgi:Fe-S-cluster containining protein